MKLARKPAPAQELPELEELDDVDDLEEVEDSSSTRKRPAPVDDDEDEDRLRPKKKKKKKKRSGSNGLIVAIVGGLAGVLVVVGIVVAVIKLDLFGGGASHESAAREIVGILEEVIAALDSVRDANTARQAATRIDALSGRIEALAERVRNLPKITKSEDERLQQKYGAQLASLTIRLKNSSERATMNSQNDITLLQSLLRMGQNFAKMKPPGM
jgi:hypothetical protein